MNPKLFLKLLLQPNAVSRRLSTLRSTSDLDRLIILSGTSEPRGASDVRKIFADVGDCRCW